MLTVLVSLCFLISGWHDATMQAMDYYTIALVLGVAVLAEIGFMLLMIVMKGLLRAATDQSSELEQVI